MDSDGQQWIKIDSDGYIIKHNLQETTAMEYYGQSWIATDRNGQRWMYYHTEWIRDDSNGILWTEMDNDRQKWIPMYSNRYVMTDNG